MCGSLCETDPALSTSVKKNVAYNMQTVNLHLNYVLIQGDLFGITAKLSKTTGISDKKLWEF